MKSLTLAGAVLALIAGPAAAQSLSDTHELRWAPAGKVPAMRYHPIKGECRRAVAPLHLAGKGPLIVPNTADADCSASAAKRQRDTVALADAR